MTTEVIYGKEAKERLAKGVKKLVESVAQTLGANGSNVTLIDNLKDPIVTKDGVTVAKCIRLHDYVENAGATIVRQAAISSADLAGDGTTTSTIIAGKIIELGLEVEDNLNLFDVRKGMKTAVEDILLHVKEEVVDILKEKKFLKNIATISANNNEEMGELVSNIISELGKGSTISISKERKDKTYFDKVEGYTYEKPLGSEFLTQVDGDVYIEIESPKLLIIDDRIKDLSSISNILKQVKEKGDSLVIMANNFDSEFIGTFLRNIYGGYLTNGKFAFVETPNYNDRLTESIIDISKCSRANVMTLSHSGKSVSKFDYSDLGEIKFFKSDSVRTTLIFDEKGTEVAKGIVNDLMNNVSSKDGSLKDRIEERIKRLSKGSAILYIGSKTDAEHKEMYDLYEDSIKACQSALEEGIVAGGGLALFKAVNKCDSTVIENVGERRGYKIMLDSATEPIRRIIQSSGKDYLEIIKKIKDKDFKFGFNAKNGRVEDLFDSGIVDPYKVTRVALESALSSATTILTTNAVVYPYDFETDIKKGVDISFG